MKIEKNTRIAKTKPWWVVLDINPITANTQDVSAAYLKAMSAVQDDVEKRKIMQALRDWGRS